MSNELLKTIKEKLDEIDFQTYNDVSDNYYNSRVGIYIAIWEKGKEIVTYRGGKSNEISFYKLQEITGRNRKNLKEWNDLFEKYPKKKEYIKEYAEPKAFEWTQKALKKEQKLIGEKEEIILPDGKYQVLYVDPPWKYNDECNEGAVQSKGANKHYSLMTVKELCELDINDLSLDNSILFLWVTAPLLEDGFKIINAWGFKYKANFVWDKVGHNMGHYNSVRHEHLLIATKGSCTPDNLKLFDSVQSIEKTKHSEKPKEFYGIIETLYSGKKIELFARNLRENWDSWGNEI